MTFLCFLYSVVCKKKLRKKAKLHTKNKKVWDLWHILPQIYTGEAYVSLTQTAETNKTEEVINEDP